MIRLTHFSRYVSVAVLAAGGDWLAFSVLISLLGAPHLESLMIARLVGGVVSFFSNRYWTWGEKRHIALTQQGRRFLVLYAVSYGLSVALFSGLHEVLAVPAYPAKLVTDVLCFLLNYLMMHAYVYHQRGGLTALLASLSGRSVPP